MNQSETVEINRFFDKGDSCHYVFSVTDQTTSDKLEKYNRKWMQVYIESFDGLDIFVSNATDVFSISSAQYVSYFYRNFTIPPTSKFYVQVQATNNTVYGQYFGKIIFKYYTYDPKCATYTNWNGTFCVPDFDAYCASLTPSYSSVSGDSSIIVYYNGSACTVGDREAVAKAKIWKYITNFSPINNLLPDDQPKIPKD